MQPTIDLIPTKEHTDVLDLLCNDLLSSFLSLGINLFKFKDIYLYKHVCRCACLYICMRMCRAEGFLISYQLRLRKTTLTKLKHMCILTFWMVSLQAAAAPRVLAREGTCGVLSPLVPKWRGWITQDERRGASSHCSVLAPSFSCFFSTSAWLGRCFSQEHHGDLVQNWGAAFEWKADSCPLLWRRLLQPCNYLMCVYGLQGREAIKRITIQCRHAKPL